MRTENEREVILVMVHIVQHFYKFALINSFRRPHQRTWRTHGLLCG